MFWKDQKMKVRQNFNFLFLKSDQFLIDYHTLLMNRTEMNIYNIHFFMSLRKRSQSSSFLHGLWVFDNIPPRDAFNANKTRFESSRIQSESVSGRSHLRLCQATCKVLLSADVLAPAGLVWSDSRPGLTCQLLSGSPLVHWPRACHWWAACCPV